MKPQLLRARFVAAAGPAVCALVAVVAVRGDRVTTAQEPVPKSAADEYTTAIRPLVKQFCLGCHSTKVKKGGLDLERFATLDDVRNDLKPLQAIIEQVEAGEMPPAEKPQPTAGEKKRLVAWARGFLDAEARSRSGDPGHVPLRRLSNAEYNYTIRDLTGVDLQPAREFPADGAAGEGFTNAAEALTDVSPALLAKYLAAAKDVSEHAVLLPDGFRFSPAKTRRDWTDEGTAALRRFYTAFAPGDGRLPVRPYLAAAVRHRDAVISGEVTLAEVAAKEGLNAKYLGVLWRALTDTAPSHPLGAVRAKWRAAAEKDVPALAAAVAAWQAALWKTVHVGNYVQPAGSGYAESLTRQVPVDPPAADSVPLRVAVKPAPGQSEVVVYLAAHEPGAGGPVVWHRPRFEAPGKPPLLLRDYAAYGPAFEVDFPTAFANSTKYLAAVVELASAAESSPDDIAARRGLDAAFLKQWVKMLALAPRKAPGDAARPAVALTPLGEKTPKDGRRPAISGWRKKGADLPIVVANSSDEVAHIPGRLSAHSVGVHPTPREFVAVTWKSPVTGRVRVAVRVAHAHPACGNGARRRGQVGDQLRPGHRGEDEGADEGAEPRARHGAADRGDPHPGLPRQAEPEDVQPLPLADGEGRGAAEGVR